MCKTSAPTVLHSCSRWKVIILHIFWPETISNQELLSRCNQESRETIIIIGHQKENISGDNPRTPGVRQWKGSSRPYSIPREPFRSWPRTDRSGDPLFLPYMPEGIHGHKWVSEWVCPYQLLSSSYWVEGGEGLPFFFWSRGGLSKNSVWCGGSWDIKKNCPFKKISSAPSAAVYIMNAALAISSVEP